MHEFMYLFRASETGAGDAMGTPEAAQRSLQKWLAWIQELEAGGHLKARGKPLERTGRVVRGPERMITDGPYVEAKDMVLGFIIIEANDLAHAAQLAMGCPMLAGDGSVEIRPVGQL